MPRFNDIINNFVNGEVSPKMYGRSDSEIYKRSCRELENRIVHPQGGASRRTGTQFILDEVIVDDANGDSAALSSAARIIPFYSKREDPFLLVFNGDVKDSSLENLVYIHDPVDTTNSFSASVVFEDNYVLDSSTATRMNPGISSAKLSTYLADATVLKEMQYCQIGDILVITHELIPPIVVTRYENYLGELVFGFGDYMHQYRKVSSFSDDIGSMPFTDINISDISMSLSAATGTGQTLTASSAFFAAGHVGTYIAGIESGTLGACVVTAVNANGLTATVDIIRAFSDITVDVAWYEGAWSDYRGWPRTVTHWNGKLVFGGSPSFPMRIWASQTYDIFEMTNEDVLKATGVVPTDPVWVDLSSDTITQINWLHTSGNLLVGTGVREYSIEALSISTTGGSEVTIKTQTSAGSNYVQPAIVEDVPMFAQKGGRKLREMLFDFRSQGYTANDVTFMAEHILRESEIDYSSASVSKITSLAYQTLDNAIVWMADNNGALVGCTRSRENTVTAFHKHPLGGTHTTGSPVVKSIAVIPSIDGASDDLYLVVERTVNSASYVSLERMGREFFAPVLNEDTDDLTRLPIFMDCAKVFRPGYTDATRSKPTFYARLSADSTAEIAGGVSTGTETGTITYVNNKMNVGTTASYISWEGIGNANVSPAEVTQIIADSRTNTSDGQYFDIDAQDGSLYRVYMDTTGASATIPAAGGRTLTEVDISAVADTAAGSGDAVAAVLGALADFSCPSTGTGTILCTDANGGIVTDAVNGDLGGAWAISTDTQGENPQVGCIRFTWHYYGEMTGTKGICAVSKSNASDDNLIYIYTDTLDQINVQVNDSAGATLFDVTFGDVQAAGIFKGPNIVEFNYDLTVGANRLFINGTQLGATNTTTGTRDTTIDYIILGNRRDGAAGIGTAGDARYLYDFAIFDTVQHTADYTPYEFQPENYTTLGHLDYLEGETVGVVADGNYLGTFTVASGAITMPAGTYDTIIVGLLYTDILEIQPVDAGTGIGSATGSIKRIDRAVIRFRATAVASVGSDIGTQEELVFRTVETPMGDPIILVTDDVVVSLNADYDRNARLVISNSVPLPSNVTCIALRGVTGDV